MDCRLVQPGQKTGCPGPYRYMMNAGNGGYISQKPLSVGLPDFDWEQISLASRLSGATWPISLLLLEAAFLLFFSLAAFQRFDAR